MFLLMSRDTSRPNAVMSMSASPSAAPPSPGWPTGTAQAEFGSGYSRPGSPGASGPWKG